jgi:hypothetical protein
VVHSWGVSVEPRLPEPAVRRSPALAGAPPLSTLAGPGQNVVAGLQDAHPLDQPAFISGRSKSIAPCLETPRSAQSSAGAIPPLAPSSFSNRPTLGQASVKTRHRSGSVPLWSKHAEPNRRIVPLVANKAHRCAIFSSAHPSRSPLAMLSIEHRPSNRSRQTIRDAPFELALRRS